ncbi:MAG: UspA domain protein [Nocardioides sp.]|nr:UspA domain protein [Nocardioides sp.]
MEQLQHEHDTVVCAIGEDGSPTALAAAAQEAERWHARLLLVHVTPLDSDQPSRALLDEARERALALYPGGPVEAELVERDWIAAGIVEAGKGARCVVVEHTHHGRLNRLLTGSKPDGIAFGATAPLLSVPRRWSEELSAPAVVTAAVQDAGEVPAVVGRAALEAHARDAELVVLHAVDRARGHDTADVDARADWVERAHRDLDVAVAEAVAAHPDLKVRLDIVLDRPVDALIHASQRSRLLVSGRRHHDHAWGSHLGPVARRLLLDASCPVLLVADDRPVATARPRVAEQPPAHERPDASPVPGDVVVAVGSDDAGGAVRFAVAEASARSAGVHVVHMVRMPSVDGVSAAEVWRLAVVDAEKLLETAAQQAREAAGPDIRVTHHLLQHGTVVRDIVEESTRASAVVIQHRQLGRLRRLVAWSTTNGVAARTDVPVFAVPADWSRGPERVGCVVVGIQDLDDAATVLPVALTEAARRVLPLRVVHAGSPTPDQRERWMSTVEEVTSAWPDVSVHRVVADADPVELLVGAVSAPELVVVGRRRHGLSHRSHLGPVARGVLEASTYPVLLAPPSAP